MQVQSIRLRQCVVLLGRVYIPIVLAVAIQSICAGDAPPRVTAGLRRGENVGVGFDLLARDHFFAPEGGELEIELNPPAGHWIIDPPDPAEATPSDESGRVIWKLTVWPVEPPTDPPLSSQHTWRGVGYVTNAGAWVRFDGELFRPGGVGAAPAPDRRYRVSVVDIDIDMDAKEVRSDVHWPPEGDLIEDEMKTDPGMRLPKSLVAGQGFPDTTDGTEYKTMELTLRTAWAGHPDKNKEAPSVLGQVEFTLDGNGIAVYDWEGQFLFDFGSDEKDRTFAITVPQLTKIPFRVLTNDDFEGERTLQAKFTWISTLQGSAQQHTAVDEIRLISYNADRTIHGPEYVPGLSTYPYRLKLLPGEQLDPDSKVKWTVDKPANAVVPEGAHEMDVEIEFKNDSAQWIMLTAEFVIGGNTLSASKRIGLVRVVLGQVMSEADGTPSVDTPMMSASGKPPAGQEATFAMKVPPGNDWVAFTTNLVPEEQQLHRVVASGHGTDPVHAAFVARAFVDLVAPEPTDGHPAHHHIEVGFVQFCAMASPTTAVYDTEPAGGGRAHIFPIEAYDPFGTLDWLSRPDVKRPTEEWPWYGVPMARTTGEGDSTTFHARLDMLDSPSMGYPSFFNLFHEGFNDQGDEDSNSHARLGSFDGTESFKLFIGVRTTCTELNAHTRLFDMSGWKKWEVWYVYPLPEGSLARLAGGQWSSPEEPTPLPDLTVVPSVTVKNRYRRQIIVQPPPQE